MRLKNCTAFREEVLISRHLANVLRETTNPMRLFPTFYDQAYVIFKNEPRALHCLKEIRRAVMDNAGAPVFISAIDRYQAETSRYLGKNPPLVTLMTWLRMNRWWFI